MLSRSSLGLTARRPIRVLQFGDGVFLRGFVDWMIDVANEKRVTDFGVAVATARPRASPPALAGQDGLYTVFERGRVDGRDFERRRVVSCIELAFDPHSDPQILRRLAASPDLRFVVSNTTEAGIVEAAEAYDPDACPANFPSRVAWTLKARFDALGGADAPGLQILPCELIEGNGRLLRQLTLACAARWGFGAAFQTWVERRCRFYDTLVDRIVPGFPAAEAEVLFAQSGHPDPLALVAEPFHLWAIEGDAGEAWPLTQAGLNVIWTDDLRPYREAKLKLLNGVHTSLAPPAFLAGLDTVGEAVADPLFARYLNAITAEIAPTVPLPDARRQAYIANVRERFANPFIRHELIAITLNSTAKWRARILPVLKQMDATPKFLAFGFAALLQFYRGEAERGSYNLRDDPAALETTSKAWGMGRPAAETAAALMQERRLWSEDLLALQPFASLVCEAASDIERVGMRGALALRWA